jgi:hypothetical protein
MSPERINALVAAALLPSSVAGAGPSRLAWCLNHLREVHGIRWSPELMDVLRRFLRLP